MTFLSISLGKRTLIWIYVTLSLVSFILGIHEVRYCHSEAGLKLGYVESKMVLMVNTAAEWQHQQQMIWLLSSESKEPI